MLRLVRFYIHSLSLKIALNLLHLEYIASPFAALPIIGGRYVFVELLGKSRWAEVWEVVDMTMNNHLAMKIALSAQLLRTEYQCLLVSLLML